LAESETRRVVGMGELYVARGKIDSKKFVFLFSLRLGGVLYDFYRRIPD
jgi:hypothetical protein